MAPTARFDDTLTGRTWGFAAPREQYVAREVADVAPVLDKVARASARGAWAFGYVGYEAAPGLDPGLPVREPIAELPLAWFGVADAPVPTHPLAADPEPAHAGREWSVDWDAARHREAVQAVKSQIAAGETYQCNLTSRARGRVDDPERFYADLALGQRGSYAAYLDLGRFVVASASPELFFETGQGQVRMRPMKGTAARGRTTAEDTDRLGVLRASPKERAENVMIVDLVRNDLTRVAETGTVVTRSLCRVERYETVFQLTSEVTAQLRPDVELVDLFRALFPCGSVTGAPKPRTMALIRDVEDAPRGVYCGAIGMVAPPGAAPFDARFSVAIRTALLDRRSGTAIFGTGGGITWSSEPAGEYREMRAKTRVLDERPADFHLIETMRLDASGNLVSGEAHLARTADSAAYFGFRFDPDDADRTLRRAVAGAGPSLVRLRAHRDGRLEVELEPLPAPPAAPVRLELDSEPVESADRWLYHKTSRRAPYSTRRTRHPQADEVLLVNERGELTEATTASLAVRLDGVWWTPPVTSGCLPGIGRARRVATAVLRERVLRPADLAASEGIALVNSLRGWRAASLQRPTRGEPSG